MLSKLSRSRSPRRYASLRRFVRSTPKARRKSRRFAVISARKSTVLKPPVAEKKEEGQGSHHTFPTEAARSHDAQFKHTELTERTDQVAKPKVGYSEARRECCEHSEVRRKVLVSLNHCKNRQQLATTNLTYYKCAV